MRNFVLLLFAMLVLAPSSTPFADTVVFSTDFESGLPAEFTATGAGIEGVQGYAGLGPVGNQFGGSFLRYTSVPLHDTQLTLTNLPPHDHLRVDFLLAVIDSWDGTELLKVSIDGVEVFSNWFQLATGDASSYVAPAGGLLSSGVNLGFSNSGYHYRDRAYDMSVDTVFTVPHSAGSVTINWYLGAVSGPAASQWQGGGDESWAIDNVKVVVSSTATGVGRTPGASATLSLMPGSPNPFSAETVFRVGAPGAGEARFEVFDVTGRRVASRDLPLGAGWQDVVFDGRDDAGRALASGVYFARVRAAGVTRAQKFVITR